MRATTLVSVKFPSILQKNKIKKHTHTFFYFIHVLLQNTHISLSILNIYSIKYSFFYTIISLTNPTQPIQPPSSSKQPPSSTHSTTIIKQLASIINPPKYPFNPATTNEIQIPTQPSHHQWNPNIHSTQPLCNKIDASHCPAMEALMRQSPQWCVNIVRSSWSTNRCLQHYTLGASKPTMHNPRWSVGRTMEEEDYEMIERESWEDWCGERKKREKERVRWESKGQERREKKILKY